jgi:hypothetical protein
VGGVSQHGIVDLLDSLGCIVPCLVDEMGIGGHGINLAADGFKLFVLVRKVLQLRGTDKGKVGGIEEKHAPLAQDILFGYKFEIVFMKCVGAEIGNFLIDHRHNLIPPKIVLIAESVDGPDFIPITKGEFCSWLVTRIQVGILDTVLRFQADPFDIVFPDHGMLYRPHSDMNGITLHLINRDMLFCGCFDGARCDLVHFLTTAHNRNAFIPDQGHDIAAMLADIKFLLHNLPPSMKVCPFLRK